MQVFNNTRSIIWVFQTIEKHICIREGFLRVFKKLIKDILRPKELIRWHCRWVISVSFPCTCFTHVRLAQWRTYHLLRIQVMTSTAVVFEDPFSTDWITIRDVNILPIRCDLKFPIGILVLSHDDHTSELWVFIWAHCVKWRISVYFFLFRKRYLLFAPGRSQETRRIYWNYPDILII